MQGQIVVHVGIVGPIIICQNNNQETRINLSYFEIANAMLIKLPNYSIRKNVWLF